MALAATYWLRGSPAWSREQWRWLPVSTCLSTHKQTPNRPNSSVSARNSKQTTRASTRNGWAGASCWAISTGATHHGALPALVRQQPDSQHESEYYQRLHESEGHRPWPQARSRMLLQRIREATTQQRTRREKPR